MSPADAIRRGVANEGGFFSPYYLFDLMARVHRDELDFDGRERERRMLPRVWRRAMARLEGGGTLGAVWREWYRELFEALGLEPVPLAGGIDAGRHGRVPVSHAVAAAGGGTLLLVDLHPFGTDLDRDAYERAATSPLDLTRETIARAFELALDHQDGRESGAARYGLLANGEELRLYRRGGSVARQFLRVDFAALFDADRDDEWTAFWGLFRRAAFLLAGDGKGLLDRVLEESQRHASRIAEDLRENVVTAVEALVQGVLDERENAVLWGGGAPDARTLGHLFEESLILLYRLLFILYAESRDVLPVGTSAAYRDTYSVEHLRDMAERDLHPDDARKTYYAEALRTLFRLLRKGFRSSDFAIPALGGRGPEDPDWSEVAADPDAALTSLFDGRRTRLLDRCRIPDRAMREVVRELSLSRPRRRRERRERYSYADLGVDQLGSIYEGLLVYEPAILDEETVVANVKGEERLLTRAQAEEHGLRIVAGSERRPGSFVLRLWGGRRKGSGSYYTPREITAFLVAEALEPLVEPVVARCAEAWAEEKRRAETDSRAEGRLVLPAPRTRIAEEILDLKVCDPAMGSGAFLIQACRYLAEAYGRALVAEGRDESGRIEAGELSRYERLVAERCLYGVDLNPLAVELAKVSLWLETLARGRPLSFLDAHLRCGNSLAGAPLRDETGRLAPEGIASIPTEALALVRDDATAEEKERARALVRRNRSLLRRMEEGRAGQASIEGLALGAPGLRETLDAWVATRAALDESDEERTDAEAHRLREEKERRFREAYLAGDAPVHRLKEVCDLWCSAWFWPEEEGEPAFDTGDYQQAAARLLAGGALPVPIHDVGTPPSQSRGRMADSGWPVADAAAHSSGLASGAGRTAPSLAAEPAPGAASWLAVARRVAAEQRFFHFELEFPEVFLRRNPGFDAVVGNPPWEKVSGSAGDLADEHDPLFKTLRGDDRDARLREILEDPATGPALVARARSRAQYARYCREGPLFRGLVAGEVNTFAPFTALGWKLHREGGAFAYVVKDAFHLTESLGPLRAEILEHGRIRVLATADNERKVFDAHNQMRFDLVVASRGVPADAVAISVHRFRPAAEIVERAREAAEVEVDLLRDDAGRPTQPIPEILDDLWPKLWAKAREAARARGSVPVRWSAELHSSTDKDCWVRGERPEGSPGPVLAMVAPFDALAYEPMAWLKPDALSRPAMRKVQWNHWRVAVRDRVNQKDERVLIGAVVSRESATCHYLNYCSEPTDDPRQVLTVAALANSLLLDYLARPFVGIHMSSGILNKLPWLVPEEGDPVLVREAARLTCTRREFAELVAALDAAPSRGSSPSSGAMGRPGAFGNTESRAGAGSRGNRGGDDCGPGSDALRVADTAPSQPPAVPLDSAADRAVARARIDARIAILYGLTAAEWAQVLAWFRLLDQDQPPLDGEPRSTITRDLALREYFCQTGAEPPRDLRALYADVRAEPAGPIRDIVDLEARLHAAVAAGAIPYQPSRRGASG